MARSAMEVRSQRHEIDCRLCTRSSRTNNARRSKGIDERVGHGSGRVVDDVGDRRREGFDCRLGEAERRGDQVLYEVRVRLGRVRQRVADGGRDDTCRAERGRQVLDRRCARLTGLLAHRFRHRADEI